MPKNKIMVLGKLNVNEKLTKFQQVASIFQGPHSDNFNLI